MIIITKRLKLLLVLLVISIIGLSVIIVSQQAQRKQDLRSQASEPATPPNLITPTGNPVCKVGVNSWSAGDSCTLPASGSGLMFAKYQCYGSATWYTATLNRCTTMAELYAIANPFCANRSNCPTPTPAITKVTLITPNGGEVWIRGNSYNISWNQNQSSVSTSLHIYTRSTTGSDTYIGAIAYNVSHVFGINNYLWKIPPVGGVWSTSPDGNNIIIEAVIRGVGGVVITKDKSNNPFTIKTATPTPNFTKATPSIRSVNPTTIYLNSPPRIGRLIVTGTGFLSGKNDGKSKVYRSLFFRDYRGMTQYIQNIGTGGEITYPTLSDNTIDTGNFTVGQLANIRGMGGTPYTYQPVRVFVEIYDYTSSGKRSLGISNAVTIYMH